MKFHKRFNVISLVALAASSAHAQDTKFGQTYTWLTEAKGEHEVELKMTRVDRDTWLSENEFETGITDRFTLAPYLNFLSVKGSPTIGGWAMEMRYRFGDLKSKSLLPAVYLEPQQMAGDSAVASQRWR